MFHGSSGRRCALLVLATGLCACRGPRQESDAAPIAVKSADASSLEAAATSAADPAAESAAPATSPVAPGAAKSSSLVHGYTSVRYRGRTTDGQDDHDLDLLLGLDFGDAKKDRITAHLLARGGVDLDGATSSDPFFSLDDTIDHSLTARLYHAWADYQPESPKPGHLERLRIGRQIDYLTPELAWFDGASAQTRAAGKHKLQIGLYGGVPVHFFESSSSGDSILGAFAEDHPWKNGRLRADWMHLEDETRLAKHENDLFSLGLWQQLSPALRVEGKYTHLEERPRDARLQATWYDPRHEWTVFVSYFELLRTQHSLALDVDPFFATLLEQFPYRQGRLLVSKALGDSLLLQGGADVRRVSDDSDIGQFNRDFERSFVTATIGEPLPLQLSLSLTGEVWNSPDTQIETWGADLSRPFGSGVDASIGSYYSLFKYDLFSIEERDDVRTYYLALRWKESSASAFDLRYEFEDSEFGDFQTLRLGARWSF
ncbi:MAG TPA: hypothetical protein VK843_22460 [Planctomycetota bacterium]|nr:hypothetical protein [Planctomycetota bacterium]